MADDKKPAIPTQLTSLAVYKGKPCPIIIPKEWGDGGCEGQFRTSLDMSSPAGKRALVQCIDGDVPGIDSQINTTLDVYGVTMHPVSFPDDETGEIVNCIRTVLHTRQGDFKAVSHGITRSLALISGVTGSPPPWEPAIKVIPRRIATSGGRSRYMLEMVG